MERQWELLSARKEDAVDATVGAQAGVALIAALMAFAWHCLLDQASPKCT